MAIPIGGNHMPWLMAGLFICVVAMTKISLELERKIDAIKTERLRQQILREGEAKRSAATEACERNPEMAREEATEEDIPLDVLETLVNHPDYDVRTDAQEITLRRFLSDKYLRDLYDKDIKTGPKCLDTEIMGDLIDSYAMKHKFVEFSDILEKGDYDTYPDPEEFYDHITHLNAFMNSGQASISVAANVRTGRTEDREGSSPVNRNRRREAQVIEVGSHTEGARINELAFELPREDHA